MENPRIVYNLKGRPKSEERIKQFFEKDRVKNESKSLPIN